MLQNCDSSIGSKFQKPSARANMLSAWTGSHRLPDCAVRLNCERDDVPGRSHKTNGIVIEAKCAPAEGKNFPGKKQAGAKLKMAHFHEVCMDIC